MKTPIQLCCVLVLSFVSLSVHAQGQGEDYVLEWRTGGPLVIYTPWGVEQRYFATPPGLVAPNPYTRRLTFELITPNFFSGASMGHIALGVRGEVSDSTGDGNVEAKGRGIIIGGVPLYPSNPPCGPTIKTNTIAMEAFWATGNCVFGPSTEGPALQNNVRYKIEIASEEGHWWLSTLRNEYSIWEFNTTLQDWVLIANEGYTEQWGDNPTPYDMAGWFIGAGINPSTPDWDILIENVEHYVGW